MKVENLKIKTDCQMCINSDRHICKTVKSWRGSKSEIFLKWATLYHECGPPEWRQFFHCFVCNVMVIWDNNIYIPLMFLFLPFWVHYRHLQVCVRFCGSIFLAPGKQPIHPNHEVLFKRPALPPNAMYIRAIWCRIFFCKKIHRFDLALNVVKNHRSNFP